VIPNSNILTERIGDSEYESKTYRINASVTTPHKIQGYVDGLEAVRQAIYLILNTERYQYPIYSWDYGVELIDLIGKPIPYVMSEVARRIDEALTQDDRIIGTENYEFEKSGRGLKVTFTVVTNVGDFQTELDVNNFTNNFGYTEPQIPDEPVPDVPSPEEPEEPDVPTPDRPCDVSDGHKHAEFQQGGITYVYCEHVNAAYIDGTTAYYPYTQYPF
jgi:phage baseplate assembly protein W